MKSCIPKSDLDDYVRLSRYRPILLCSDKIRFAPRSMMKALYTCSITALRKRLRTSSTRKTVLIRLTNILLQLSILTIGSIVVNSRRRARDSLHYSLRLIVRKSVSIIVRCIVRILVLQTQILLSDSRTIRKGPPKIRMRLPTSTIVRKITLNVTTIVQRRNRGRSQDVRLLLSIELRYILLIVRP